MNAYSSKRVTEYFRTKRESRGASLASLAKRRMSSQTTVLLGRTLVHAGDTGIGGNAPWNRSIKAIVPPSNTIAVPLMHILCK